MQEAQEARRREAALERERKAALMQHLFTHGTRGELRKVTEIGEMPESWRVARLGKLITEGPQNGLYKPASFYGGGTPILRIDAFDNGDIIARQELKRLQLSEEELHRYSLNSEDIVMNRVNGNPDILGKCALVGELAEATVFESNMIRFAVDREVIRSTYLLYFLYSSFGRQQIKKRARITHQTSINQQDIDSIEITLPKLAEQQEIASVLCACDDKIDALEREAAALEEAFRALLEELMTGRARAIGDEM